MPFKTTCNLHLKSLKVEGPGAGLRFGICPKQFRWLNTPIPHSNRAGRWEAAFRLQGALGLIQAHSKSIEQSVIAVKQRSRLPPPVCPHLCHTLRVRKGFALSPAPPWQAGVNAESGLFFVHSSREWSKVSDC